MTRPELHRPVAVDRVGAAGLEVTVTADEAECQRLAVRMGLPAVAAFTCRFRLAPLPGGAVLARGDLRAAVTRICVVTLDAFETTVAERFQVRFVPAGQESDDDDPESDDEIPCTGGVIDLGEAAAEQFALALDPYPRKPDAAPAHPDGDAAASPFAPLAGLRRGG